MFQAIVLVIITSLFLGFLKYPYIIKNQNTDDKNLLITDNLIEKYSSIYSIPDSVFNKSYISLYLFLKKSGINVFWDYTFNNINKYNKIFLTKNLKDCNLNKFENLKHWVSEGGDLVLFIEPDLNNLIILREIFQSIKFDLIKSNNILFLSPFDLKFSPIMKENRFLWYIEKSDKMIPYYCIADFYETLFYRTNFKQIYKKKENIVSSLLYKIPYFNGNIFVVSDPSIFNVENLQNNLQENNVILKTIDSIKYIKLFYFISLISLLFSFILLIKYRLLFVFFLFFIISLYFLLPNTSFDKKEIVETAYIDINDYKASNKLSNILSRYFILVDRKCVFNFYKYVFTDKEDFREVNNKYFILIDDYEKIDSNNIIDFIFKNQ